MEIRFDTYYTNEELTDRLRHLAEAHPDVCELRSLGRSHEDRDIPLLVLTNRATGPDLEKPAMWVDANIHATELTGSMAALHLIHRVLTTYREDAAVRRLLDQQAFYVVPRLNPDGAARALSGSPKYIRSGTRPYPTPFPQDGLHQEDVDGDGRVLQMRVPDPSGEWKPSEEDPRLMVPRGIAEEGGTYYRLFPEGRIEGFEEHLIVTAPPLEGLDFNRNFPGSWRPEGKQQGAGEHPGSEPEIRAVLEFFKDHPNVFAAITYHTFSRVILRPYGTKKDEDMETEDLWVFEAIGERGTELTGYPCASVYHDFKYHPKEVITGVFDDWLYDHKGIFAFTVELWDLPSAAGIDKNEKKNFIDWFRKHPIEDDLKILAFAKEHAPEGLVEWYPFDHPQLGRVELGGWDTFRTWRNPPERLLEAEIEPQAAFALQLAALAPRLAWRVIEVEPVGDGTWHLVVVVENTGFLPTFVSKQALNMKAAHPVRLELTLPEGAELVSGKLRKDLGHLEGRANNMGATSMWYHSSTTNRGKSEWIVRAAAGTEVSLAALSDRAGTIRKVVTLEVQAEA